jgi:hypothetical protein
MLLANTLFVAFALFTAIGAYLLFAQRSRGTGVLAALGVLLFFAALFFGILRLITSGGAPP